MASNTKYRREHERASFAVESSTLLLALKCTHIFIFFLFAPKQRIYVISFDVNGISMFVQSLIWEWKDDIDVTNQIGHIWTESLDWSSKKDLKCDTKWREESFSWERGDIELILLTRHALLENLIKQKHDLTQCQKSGNTEVKQPFDPFLYRCLTCPPISRSIKLIHGPTGSDSSCLVDSGRLVGQERFSWGKVPPPWYDTHEPLKPELFLRPKRKG